MRTTVLLLITAVAAPVAVVAGQHDHHAKPSQGFSIPASLKADHEELHAELAAAVKAGGKTGAAAQEVERALAPHFASEEEYALPPLGLLKALSEGEVTPEMHPIAQKAARLKTELPRMLEEHQAIVKTLGVLETAARNEQQERAIRFAEGLRRHAQNEEEVLYPAAILVGEYLALKKK